MLIFFQLNLIVHKFSASIHFVWVFTGSRYCLCYFFLIGSVCVNFLSPEPDCAHIFSLHSFCMGFSLVAGTVCVIFFLIGLVCANFLSPEPDCAQIFSLHSFCLGFSLVTGSVCVIFFLIRLVCVIFFLVGSVCVFCLGPKCNIISINKSDFSLLRYCNH